MPDQSELSQQNKGLPFQQSGLAWFWLALLIIVLDQSTKILALSFLAPYEPVSLLPIFNLTLAFNPGAAFSFLGDAGGWQRWFFIALAMMVSVALLVWLRKTAKSNKVLVIGLLAVLGGALGNVIDRIAYQHVVDFLDFHWHFWHYPTFNIADIAITLGALLLVWDAWRSDRKRAA